ncbi:MAG: shikimate kinase [Bacteroidota bacterium]|nr:shikimate kinase [Bacteroidota bacterium]
MTTKKNNLIYLTGFMGSGKSTIAPILANTLGYSHADIDQEIECLTSKSVTSIFSDFGEDYFREIERSLLLELSNRDCYVISLGGGTIANATNLKIVKSSGILIYLKTDVEQIQRRLKFKKDRPLIQSANKTLLTDDELRSRITSLIAKREPYYEKADIVITTTKQRVGITVDEIVYRLKNYIK